MFRPNVISFEVPGVGQMRTEDFEIESGNADVGNGEFRSSRISEVRIGVRGQFWEMMW